MNFNDFSGTVAETSAALVFETTDRYVELLDEDVDTDSDTLSDSSFSSSVAVQTSNYLTVMDGWFKAPATGNFRFYMSCDDECKLEFDQANHYGSGNAISMTELLTHTSAMTWRSYLYNGNNDILRSSY
jgi:hypothetical protein